MSTKHIERQLRRLGLSLSEPPTLESWQRFVSSVALTYEDMDRDRALLERSTTIFSQEMNALNERLQLERDLFAHTFDAAPVGMVRLDRDHTIASMNDQMTNIVDRPLAEFLHQPLEVLLHDSDIPSIRAILSELAQGGNDVRRGTFHLRHRAGHPIEAKYGIAVLRNRRDGSCRFVFVVEDVTERNRLEMELRLSQKLESVGRLAAGVAHEINTPIQFIGDNVNFLRDVFTDMVPLVDTLHRHCEQARHGPLTDDHWQEIVEAHEDADVEFAKENLPRAVEATLDGVRRVARIVQSMKSFAHPDHGVKTTADLNAAIQSTLVVANNELKYVADVSTDLGTLPPVPCYLSDLNQVVLNLLINAAHAIEDVVKGSEEKGVITVRTRAQDEWVTIEVGDTGGGIPPEIQPKMFDPFFTTKEVGKGTGQGLAIARSVVDRHGGKLTYSTEVGKGTTFTVWLPLLQEATSEAQESADAG